jgi:hypothetical protein
MELDLIVMQEPAEEGGGGGALAALGPSHGRRQTKPPRHDLMQEDGDHREGGIHDPQRHR